MALATTRRPSATPRADATRCASVAMPRRGFSGFPGETSSHTWSSRSRRRASSATWRWPSCAGLNDPPNRPTRLRLRSPKRGTGSWIRGVFPTGVFNVTWSRCRARSGTYLPGAAHQVTVGGKLLQSDRPAGMDAPGGDADLGAETEFAAVAELRGGVP